MYRLIIPEQTITLGGRLYKPGVFAGEMLPEFSQGAFLEGLFFFLQEWFSESPYVKVKTSGSTGAPKEMLVEKERVMRSAQLTCSFLNLQKGDTALLCMPLNYIAGKMVVVRALVAGLDLYPVEPCGNPLKDIDVPFRFAAMVPMQVYNSIQSKVEKVRLANIENLIIGGGAIDVALDDELQDFPNNVYSTYGMTETLSHIAMRKLNGAERSDFYIPFPSVSLSLSYDDTLIIDAPLVAEERLYTNDVAEIHKDGSFRIIGRKDNIINSGGIKIQIEAVEALLMPVLNCRFAITSLPDPKFGEAIVLVVEDEIDEVLLVVLPKYYHPRKVIRASIPMTETGKINRSELKEMIKHI